MIIRFDTWPAEISVATAVLCAALPVLYPILGRYHHKGDHADYAVLWHEAQQTVTRVFVALGYCHDYKVICDATCNTPDQIEQGKLGIKLFAKLNQSADAYSGHYVLRWIETGVVGVEIL